MGETEKNIQQLLHEHLRLNNIFIAVRELKKGAILKVAKLLHYKDREILIQNSNKLKDTTCFMK